MRKKASIITLLILVCIMGGCIQPSEIRADESLPFDDIAPSYARTQILDLYKRGLVYGEGNRTYGPRKPVTREAMATMLGRTIGLVPIRAAIPAFKDVGQTSWSYDFVQAGVTTGLISGVSRDEFAPKRAITRQEAASLLYRSLPKKKTVQGKALPFRDTDKIADWARPAVAELYARGLMIGSQGQFRPHDRLTREEMAVLLYNLLHQSDFEKHTVHNGMLQMGWQYDISTDEFTTRVKKANGMNIVSPRWYFLTSSGNLTDTTERSLLTWANKNKREVWPLVGNRFNQELTHQILTDSAKRMALVRQLTEYTKKYQLDGLNIDFENIAPTDRSYFTAFIAELSNALHSLNKKVSVDVPPDLGDDWSEPYDFSSLARYVDYVVLMAYNETWEGKGVAGSNASLPWLEKHVKRMLTLMPKERLIVALPFYTMRWQEVNGKAEPEEITMANSFKDVQTSGIRPVWDTRLGQYYITYRKQGKIYKVWLEESRSLALKYRTVKELGAAGTAFWHVGAEADEVWAAIQNEQ